jgi:hypothetical protein
MNSMVAFRAPFQALTNVLTRSICSRTSKIPLKSQNPLSKEMDEMRNRMRANGSESVFRTLANPRHLSHESFLQKTIKNQK